MASTRSGPEVAWHRQVLSTAGVAICSGMLDTSSSASRLRHRLTELDVEFPVLDQLSGFEWRRLNILSRRSPMKIRFRCWSSLWRGVIGR